MITDSPGPYPTGRCIGAPREPATTFRHLITTAQDYLESNGLEESQSRSGLVSSHLDTFGELLEIHHLEHVVEGSITPMHRAARREMNGGAGTNATVTQEVSYFLWQGTGLKEVRQIPLESAGKENSRGHKRT